MQFYSDAFMSTSHEAGTERHKMEQSLSRFVTPVELGKCVKKGIISLLPHSITPTIHCEPTDSLPLIKTIRQSRVILSYL
jgi:hypothetical protein